MSDPCSTSKSGPTSIPASASDLSPKLEFGGPIGSLTVSGPLYQGIFKSWWERMQLLLWRNDLCWRSSLPRRQYGYELLGSTDDKKKKSALLIRCMVDPCLLHRVPFEDWDDPFALLKQLEIMSTPFRLLDLPPELRCIIYSWVLRGGYNLVMIASTWTEAYIDPLMHVCSTIRKEFAPIFHGNTDLCLIRSDCDTSTEWAEAARMFISWTKDIVGEWTRYLTSIDITIHPFVQDPEFEDMDERKICSIQLSLDASGRVTSKGVTSQDGTVVNSTIHDQIDTLEEFRDIFDSKKDPLLAAAVSAFMLSKGWPEDRD